MGLLCLFITLNKLTLAYASPWEGEGRCVRTARPSSYGISVTLSLAVVMGILRRLLSPLAYLGPNLCSFLDDVQSYTCLSDLVCVHILRAQRILQQLWQDKVNMFSQKCIEIYEFLRWTEWSVTRIGNLITDVEKILSIYSYNDMRRSKSG
jgi:hypothetical protein